jgi:photosystem II stability/assembly factor-like uncharacterized protein
MEKYFPPEVVAGFARGFWNAFIAGGVVFFGLAATEGMEAAWFGFGTAFFAALLARTGEGYRDSRKAGSEVRLDPVEQEVINRLRDGSLDYDPYANPPPR